MSETIISLKYLRENPDHVFVFGDNRLRRGKRGGAFLRDEPNAYGFITKKRPSGNNDAFYRPSEYREVFDTEISKLVSKIVSEPQKVFLISKIGSGLANRYHIWEKIIRPGLQQLKSYRNVRFLYE